MSNFFKYLLVSILCAILIYQQKIDLASLKVLFEVPDVTLVIFVYWFLSSVTICSWRWQMILRAFGAPMRRWEAWVFNLIGIFFATVLPGAAAGDLTKAIYVHKYCPQISKRSILLSLAADRALGLFAMIFFAVIAVIFNFDLVKAYVGLHLVALVMILFLMCLVPLFLSLRFGKLSKVYRQHPVAFVYSLFFALLHQFLTIAMFIWLSNKILGVTDRSLTLVIALGTLIAAIPLAPGGLGIGHLTFEGLYTWGGFSQGANIFNLSFVAQMFFGLFGAVAFLVGVPKLLKKRFFTCV